MADRLTISINNFELRYALIDASGAYDNGIKITGTNVKLYNLTIYAPNGIAIDADESCEIINCVTIGNTQDIDIATGKTVTSKNNCFQHHNNSTHNIGLGTLSDSNSIFGKDPLLKDLSGEDYSLQYVSPCMNKGLSIGLFRDINGNVVPFGDGVDIGAYEYGYGDGEMGTGIDLSPIFNFNFNFDF